MFHSPDWHQGDYAADCMKSLRCLQINLRRSEEAAGALRTKLMERKETGVDVVLIQEPNLYELDRWRYTMPEYRAFHNLNEREKGYGAAVLVHQKWPAEVVGYRSNYAVGVRVQVGQNFVDMYSVYCRPKMSLIEIVEPVLAYLQDRGDRSVLGMDANAKHTSWNSDTTNERGRALAYKLRRKHLKVANRLSEWSYEPGKTGFIDVTANGNGVQISDWKYLRRAIHSDHPLIQFDVEL